VPAEPVVSSQSRRLANVAGSAAAGVAEPYENVADTPAASRSDVSRIHSPAASVGNTWDA
jgi:hypothetical protein